MHNIAVVYRPGDRRHDIESLSSMARYLAKTCASQHVATCTDFHTHNLYFMPGFALSRQHVTRDLTESEFLGGLVDYEFMTTKLITHPAWHAESQLPDGWVEPMAVDLRAAVLPGFSTFSQSAALAAGSALLADGPIRIKQPYARAGRGQTVILDTAALRSFLDRHPEPQLAEGLVIETNIEASRTYSIGQIRVADMAISYIGRQFDGPDLLGDKVYKGSRLFVVRGGWDNLLRQCSGGRPLIDAALTYDRAAAKHLNMIASRKNYDVLVSTGSDYPPRLGVLEQSWRIGGATPAEILAMRILRDNGRASAARTVVHEKYGDPPYFHANDLVVYSGLNEKGQPLHKYARVEKLYYD